MDMGTKKPWKGLRAALLQEATKTQRRTAREQAAREDADAKLRARANEVLGPPAFGGPDDVEREHARLRHEATLADADAVLGREVEEDGALFDPDVPVEREVVGIRDLRRQAEAAQHTEVVPPTMAEVLRTLEHEITHLDRVVDRRGEALEDLREAVGKREVDVSRELTALRESLTVLDTFVGEQDRGFRRVAEAVTDRHVTVERRLEKLEDHVGVLLSGEGAEAERDALGDLQESVRTLVRSVEHIAADMQTLEGARAQQEGRLRSVERNVAGHEASLGHLARVGAAALERLGTQPAVHLRGTILGDVARGLEDVIASGDEVLKAAGVQPVPAEETRVDFGEPERLAGPYAAEAWREKAMEAERAREKSRRERLDMLRRLREVEGQRDEANGALLRLAKRAGLKDIPGPDEIADEVGGELQALRMDRKRLQERLSQIATEVGEADHRVTPANVRDRVSAWRHSAEVRGEKLQEIARALGHVWQPRNGIPDPDRLVLVAQEVRAKADAPGEAWERVHAALKVPDGAAWLPHVLASQVEDVIAERDSLRDRKASGAAAEDTAMVRQLRERLGMPAMGGDPIELLDDVLGRARAVDTALNAWRAAGDRAKAAAAQAEEAAQRGQVAASAATSSHRWAQQGEMHARRVRDVLANVE